MFITFFIYITNVLTQKSQNEKGYCYNEHYAKIDTKEENSEVRGTTAKIYLKK